MHSTMESDSNCLQDSDCDSDGDSFDAIEIGYCIQEMTAMMKAVIFFLMLQRSVMELIIIGNAQTDEGSASVTDWFRDQDGDEQGDSESLLSACTQPDGYVENADDCDDNDPTTYVGSAELDSIETLCMKDE